MAQPSALLQNAAVAVLLAVHFGCLVLNNLPWSPFVARLYPLYGTYIKMTGQTQLWAMYRFPFHGNPVYEIEAEGPAEPSEEIPFGQSAYGSRHGAATLPASAKLYPLGKSREWSPRFLYLAEGLSGDEDAARAFLSHVQGSQELASLKLIKTIAIAPAFGDSLTSQNQQYEVEKEIRLKR